MWNAHTYANQIVDTDIADTVTNITGIPVNKLAKEEQSTPPAPVITTV